MKQFNVEEYLKKHRRDVVTRDGRKARILCCDLKNDPYTVVAAIMDGNIEVPVTYSKQGKAILARDSNSDLFFAPKKHEGWANMYRDTVGKVYFGNVYSSEEEAKKSATSLLDTYVATAKVEWEEE